MEDVGDSSRAASRSSNYSDVFAVQNFLDTFNSFLGWCQMTFKPAKSRSLALVKGKICSDVPFVVAGQRVPTVSEEPVKSLGRFF